MVLLDIVMPGVDGLAALDQIRADPALHELMVVMVSGHQAIDNEVQAIERGANGYLTKPIRAPLLHARVNACVERNQARAHGRQLVADLQVANDRSEALLRHMLPPTIARRLLANPARIADIIADASVVFVDLVGFTALAHNSGPDSIVNCLIDLFGSYDRLAEKLGVEKIKTIGDAYLAVAGVPEPRADHVEVAVRFARAASMQARQITGPDGAPLQVRVGVHCGPLVAGVVGTHRFAYDVWGDTVNTAARLQTACSPGGVLLSDTVRTRLCAKEWRMSDALAFQLKGKGRMSAVYLMAEA